MVPTFGPAVAAALPALDPRDRYVLEARGLSDVRGTMPRTLQELADEYGVTRERIRQVEQRAWRRLLRQVALGDWRIGVTRRGVRPRVDHARRP